MQYSAQTIIHTAIQDLKKRGLQKNNIWHNKRPKNESHAQGGGTQEMKPPSSVR